MSKIFIHRKMFDAEAFPGIRLGTVSNGITFTVDCFSTHSFYDVTSFAIWMMLSLI